MTPRPLRLHPLPLPVLGPARVKVPETRGPTPSPREKATTESKRRETVGILSGAPPAAPGRASPTVLRAVLMAMDRELVPPGV